MEERGYRYWDVYKDYRKRGWGILAYTGDFSAIGIMKQVMWVDPAKNLIMVRLGEHGDKEYEALFFSLAKIL